MKKVLVANRGEIAVRIIRALREMKIPSVAVFSTPDRSSLPVRFADEACWIGEAPALESYLDGKKLLEVAQKMKCDAIHPGYGFLSENAEFSRNCASVCIQFIGPNAESMEAMATKVEARKRMKKAGVPVVPGSEEPLVEGEETLVLAREVGYPIMLKASSGGGGKGMRLVHEEEDLLSALTQARSESRQAFADDAVYMEKALVSPKHIEVQILADSQGNCIALGERECSVQRRHQKVIEEAPSPAVSAEMRSAMEEAACRAATAVGYVGAGTVEFLMDSSGNWYFMEMNTRLQVEHGVTELVHGVDLVRWQIKVAQGEALDKALLEKTPRGWAMEARVYAEDPQQNFMPCPGLIQDIRLPSGPGVRVDSALFPGMEVSLYYDPMLAKIMAWGEDREMARCRLALALEECQVIGVTTNISYLRQLIEQESFKTGKYHTGMAEALARENANVTPPPEAVMAALLHSYTEAASPLVVSPPHSKWRKTGIWEPLS